jgi:hypothetical protein
MSLEMKIIAPILVSLFLASISEAQELLVSPSLNVSLPTERHTRKEFWMLFAVDKGFKIWDIELSQYRQRHNLDWHEDVIWLPKRPSRVRCYGQFMGGALVADYFSWRLRRRHHKNLARIIQVSGIGLSLWGIGYTYRHKR